MMMILFITGGKYLCFEWCWHTAHSGGSCEQNLSTVAVIDGGLLCSLLLFYQKPYSIIHSEKKKLDVRCLTNQTN